MCVIEWIAGVSSLRLSAHEVWRTHNYIVLINISVTIFVHVHSAGTTLIVCIDTMMQKRYKK